MAVPADSQPVVARSALLVGVDLSTGGGVNRVIRDLSCIFSEELGFKTHVVNARSSRAPTYPFPERVTLEQAAPEKSGLWSYLVTLLRLRRRRFDFAIGFWAQDNLMLLLSFLFSGTRVIVCEHTSHFNMPPLVRVLRRMLYRLAWRVVVLNRAEAVYYERFLHTVRLLPNPVEVHDLPSRQREKLVIGVGHLTVRKGFSDLILAMQAAGLASSGWQCVIIGKGPEQARLQALADRTPGLVKFVAPSSAISEWYKRAALIVITSDIEVFSLVLAEAANCGVVPVAYDADGPSFLLEKFPELLVPIGDIDALAGTISRLTERDRLTELARAVQDDIVAKTSRSRVASLWRSLIQEAEN